MYISSKVCKNCGQIFTPKRKHGTYCKDSCRIAGYKRRHGIPKPDFNLISKVKIDSKAQLQQAEIQSRLRQLIMKYDELEKKEKPWLNDEQAYERALKRKQDYEEKKAAGKEIYYTPTDYAMSQGMEMTNRAIQMLKPMREEKAKLIAQIEKEREALKKVEQTIYIEQNRTSDKLHTAADIVSKQFSVLDFEGKWKTLLGKPERGFTAVVYGAKFSGKSTFAISFLDYLSRFGKCVYFSVEEGVKMTLQNKLKELNIDIKNKNLFFSDEQLPDAIMAMSKKFDFAVIDSLTTAGITADDLRNAKLRGVQTSYIGINHITTDGRAKGGTGQEHNPDMVIRIEPFGNAIVEKNRYHEE